LELKVINSERSREDIARDAQRALPHLPIFIWEGTEYQSWYYKNASCARFPDVYNLEMYDHYWQSIRTAWAKFHLYGAYYDVRRQCSICPAVRILGMIDSEKPPVRKLYCQIWFADRNEPVIVKAIEYFNILPRYWEEIFDDLLYAYLITCPVPREFRPQQPIFVSLVEKECDRATNILTVYYNQPTVAHKKDRFAVCVKTVDYHHKDVSPRLIEWIELARLLGANKIFFYILRAHENMTKVLEHYRQEGLVEVVPITLGGNEPNSVNFQHLHLYKEGRNWYQRSIHELISMNDFFYKNMYKYDYLSPFDLDEMIVPVKQDNWYDLSLDENEHFTQLARWTWSRL
jgi:hypothetical protein